MSLALSSGVLTEEWGQQVQWDPSATHSGIVISNGGLKATCTTTNVSTIGNIGYSAGLYYAEIKIITLVSSDMVIGACNGNSSTYYNSYPGHTTQGFAINASTGVFTQTGLTGTPTSFGAVPANAIIGIALNLTTGDAWISVNGTWANSGNPATGSNPLWTGLTATWYLSVGFNTATSQVAELNTPLFYPVPAGFSPFLQQVSAGPPNIALCLHFDNFITDCSPYNTIINNTGAVTVSTTNVQTGFNECGQFNGTSNYLSFTSNNFPSLTPFTIECFFNTATVSGKPVIFSQRTGVTTTNVRWAMYVASSELVIGYDGGGHSGAFITGSTTISISTWYHAAFTFDGTTYRLFLNGVSQGSSTNAFTSDTATNYNLGYEQNGTAASTYGTNYWDGQLDDFRISQTCLYTTGFTPSTLPLAPMTIDSSQSATGYTLTNRNLTSTGSATSFNHACFANIPISSGKYYAEFLVTAVDTATFYPYVGAANGTTTTFRNSFVGGITQGFGWSSAGGTHISGITLNGTSAPAYFPGDVLGLAIDITNGNAWFSYNGVWVYGNPVTATTPTITGMTGSWSVGMSAWNENLTQTILQSVQGAFKYAPPTGFLQYGL